MTWLVWRAWVAPVEDFKNCSMPTIVVIRYSDNRRHHTLINRPDYPSVGDDVLKLCG
jgi:hypothetical protein